jgi:importin subunit beta-1
MSELLQHLGTEGASPVLRMNAALYIKNLFVKTNAADHANAVRQWISLSHECKTRAKTTCLHVMLSPVKEARQGAAALTACIAVLEFSNNEWLDLIEVLQGRATEEGGDAGRRITALETLGWICEDVMQFAVDEDQRQPKEIMAPHAASILSAVVHGMRPEETDPNVRRAATDALYNTIEFAEKSFDTDFERTYIMNVIFAATEAQLTDMRAKAYSCLVQVADRYYAKLPEYIESIFGRTNAVLKNPDEDEPVKLQAIEFWSTLADCEAEIQEVIAEEAETGQPITEVLHNIIPPVFPHLAPALLQLLPVEEDLDPDDIDTGEWTLAMASAQCIRSIAICIGDQVVDIIQQYTTTNIVNPDWRLREAAVMAYGSIMDGPDEGLAPHLPLALPKLLELMVNDPSLHVRDTSAWALGTAYQLHSPVLVAVPLLQATLSCVLEVMRRKDVPSICSSACWVIDSIAYVVVHEAIDSTPVEEVFADLVDQLIATSQREDGEEKNLRLTAVEALNSLIAATPASLSANLIQLVFFFVAELDKVSAMVPTDAVSRQYQHDRQATHCSALAVLCHKLEMNLPDGAAEAIMAACLRVFESGADQGIVVEEVLKCVGALANAREDAFPQFMERFAPHLFSALRKTDPPSVCSTAVGVVCDCCRALGPEFAPYMKVTLDGFMAALQVVDAKLLTLSVLGAYGDVAMACGAAFFPHVESLMGVLKLAAETKVPLTSQEAIEYYHGLLEAIVDACVGLVNGFDSVETAAELPPNVPKFTEFMFLFVLHVVNLEPAVPDSCFGAAVGLACDIGRVLGRFDVSVLRYMADNASLTALFQRALGADEQSIRDSASTALALIARATQ